MAGLTRLLNPKTLAVIGGGTWCASVIEQAQKIGFQGQIFPVHPKRDTVAGLHAFASLAKCPDPIDAAFVGVNREATLSVIAELNQLNAGGAVCFASGFLETAGDDNQALTRQNRLVEAAGDMPFLGPNCYGFVNALDRVAVWPDQHGMKPVDRGVAILTQSSNIAINLTMQARGLPIACMITCGNQAQTSQAALTRALLDDPRVTAIGLHIEGFGNVADWWEVAQTAAARNIPVLAIKVGASEEARIATVSHTASLAGSDAGADALLRHLGFARTDNLATFLETLKLLHMFGPLDAPTLSSISCSGGEASLVADMARDLPVTFPALKDTQKQSLKRALGPKVTLANPLDYHTYIWRDVPAMTEAWRPMAADHIGLTLSIVDYPRTDAADWACTTQAALAVAQASGRPFAVVASLPELMPEGTAQHLMEHGVLAGNGLREVLEAAALASHWPKLETDAPLAAGPDRVNQRLLTEADAKAELAGCGLTVPQGVVAQNPDAARHLKAPLAVKSLGLAHKSDSGGVRLHQSQSDLTTAMQDMPGETFLIEEMVTEPLVELLLGVTRDPAHGFVLTLGAGGTDTEILQDTASVLLPTSRTAVRAVLSRLRIAPRFAGYRGSPPICESALLDTVDALQGYVLAHHDQIEEVEINPLICTATGAFAVDALIRKGD